MSNARSRYGVTINVLSTNGGAHDEILQGKRRGSGKRNPFFRPQFGNRDRPGHQGDGQGGKRRKLGNASRRAGGDPGGGPDDQRRARHLSAPHRSEEHTSELQ